MMKTKREVLKVIAKNGTCEGIVCINCPYEYAKHCPITATIKRIGAMAILRMFREKKNPIFTVGTQIKFDNGETTTLVFLKKEYCLMFANHKEKLDYLIGKTWEVVE